MIEIERLRELLSYDASTGLLTWRVNRRGGARAGSAAGALDRCGYLRVFVLGSSRMAHRVAWALHYGSWPAWDIDHIDGRKTNNRISNLRDVSKSENMQNLKRAQRNNRSGSKIQGVCWHKRDQRFRAQACIDGKVIYLGDFVALADAEAASLAYRREHYAGFTL